MAYCRLFFYITFVMISEMRHLQPAIIEYHEYALERVARMFESLVCLKQWAEHFLKFKDVGTFAITSFSHAFVERIFFDMFFHLLFIGIHLPTISTLTMGARLLSNLLPLKVSTSFKLNRGKNQTKPMVMFTSKQHCVLVKIFDFGAKERTDWHSISSKMWTRKKATHSNPIDAIWI